MKNKDVFNRNKNNDSIIFNYVDGLCGSGKTYGLGQYIKHAQLQQKFMITTPSKALADQIYQQLMELGIVNVHRIYSTENHRASNVPQRIMNAIQVINAEGQGVIICTQQVFPHIHFIENQAEWVLVVDEIPVIDKFDALALPYNHTLISHYMRIKERVGAETYELDVNDEVARLGSHVDAINEVIRPIIEDSYSTHYRCFTDKTQWDRLIQQHLISDDAVYDLGYGNELNKLYFLRLLQPSIYHGFAQVIIMGANFESSLLYKYWTEYANVRFIQCNAIVHYLRYSEYSHGHRLTLKYLQETDWSKHGANQEIKGKTKLQHFAELVNGHMGTKPFIYMTNNSDKTEFTYGIKAPVISHGMNHYSTIDNIYFSPALNNQPKHTKMLVDLGFNPLFIKRALSYEVAHQAIMRTSLRNPESETAVTAIVVDRGTAYAIAGLFPGCKLGPIDGYLRKVKALGETEKKAKSRLTKLIELRELNSVVNSMPTSPSYDQQRDNSLKIALENEAWENLSTKSYIREKGGQNFPIHNKTIEINEKSSALDAFYTDSPYIGRGIQNFPYEAPDFLDMSLGVSFMSSIYNKSVASMDSTPMDFVKTMQSIHTNHIIRTKDESILFNGIKYKTEQTRALDNVDHASLVVVDIDNGDLSPEAFRDIFTYQYKHSFFMCNSYSRSEVKPNNYRAVFFINQPVNDDIYRDIQSYIHSVIERCGYITCWPKDRQKYLDKAPNTKFSGIDLSKNHTASFFYIPCKVQDRLEWSFFWRGNLKDLAQLKRYAIDVEKVIQYAPDVQLFPRVVFETPHKPTSITSDSCFHQGFINHEAIKQFIKEGDFVHLGLHHTYGKMAAAMNEAGFTEADFIEITPYISSAKTANNARTYWRTWGKYTGIKRGTLFYLLGLTKAA